MLLLDVNRSNNIFRASSPIRPLGIRLALHWMSWLQHTMLTYTRAGMSEPRRVAALRAFIAGLAAVMRSPFVIVAVTMITMVMALPFAVALGSRLQASLALQPPVALDGNRNRSGMVAGIPRARARVGGHLHAGGARLCRAARQHQRGARWTAAAAGRAGTAGLVDRGCGRFCGAASCAAAMPATRSAFERSSTPASSTRPASSPSPLRPLSASWSCI